MQTTLNKRIKILVELKSDNENDFASKLGMKRSDSVYNYTSNKSVPGSGFLIKVLQTFPDVSAEWLMRGIGDIIKPKYSTVPEDLDQNSIEILDQAYQVLHTTKSKIERHKAIRLINSILMADYAIREKNLKDLDKKS